MSRSSYFSSTTYLQKKCLCWLIHAFTASGACIGLFALYAVYQHHFILAFWLMGVTIVIDAVDGMFARAMKVKDVIPKIDGALLDNIVDFFTYTLVPCFFLLISTVLPSAWRAIGVSMVIFASAYQFTQVDAKTSDHFFKGFPSYWNIVAFYLFFWQMPSYFNLVILLILSILSFIPIKYIYPSRLEYLTPYKWLKKTMVVLTVCWGMATLGLLWLYPVSNPFLVTISMSYCLVYLALSLYRTYYPLNRMSNN